MKSKNHTIQAAIDTIQMSLVIHPEISGIFGDLGEIFINQLLLGSTVIARLGGQSETKLFHSICAAVIGCGFHVKSAIRIATICTNASHIRNKIIFLILSNIQRHSSTASTIVLKLLSSKIKSADSFATSVASFTTIHISALFNAGASFTPSPIIATTSPSFLSSSTIRIFCSGLVLANNLTDESFSNHIQSSSSLISAS